MWSWTSRGCGEPVEWTYFHLYVILDLFSRCAIGWVVAERETTA